MPGKMRTTVILALLLLGVITGHSLANNGTIGGMNSIDRFRRLIPYMTFYFAQQNRAVQPEYSTYSDGSTSKNKIPQYKGNLVLPTSYRPTSQQPSNPVSDHVVRPHPFTTATTPIYIKKKEPINYDPFLYTDSYLGRVTETFGPEDAKIHTTSIPAIKPQIPKSRTLSLLQILHLIQEARKLPQSANLSGEQTLSQILHLLRETNMISPATENTLAKIFYQLPHYRKIYPSPIITNNGAAGVYSPTIQPHTQNPNGFLDPIAPSPQPFLPAYAYSTHPSKTSSPVVSTPTTVENSDYDYGDSLEQNSPPKIITTKLVQVTTPTPALNDNELYSYEYIPKTPQTQKIPISKIKTAVPINKAQIYASTLLPPTENELRNLNYPPQAQVFYKIKAQVQSFPDPSSTGSTPGRPGIDYPVLSTIPQTSFSCKTQRYKGFFGDPDTSCQVWHYCDLNGGQASFLCPNGTIFSQVALTCDWWFNVRCASTTQLYVLNERLYKYILPVTPSFPEDFTGPLVDQYLALKFKELELKNKKKEKSDSKDNPK